MPFCDIIIFCTLLNVKLATMMMMKKVKHVTHEHHILWSAPLSSLSRGAFVSCFCICTLYYMCCASVSHQCICGNNQNRMDFLNPMTITWSVVITVIKILMVRTILNGYIIRSKIKCDAELLRICSWLLMIQTI